MGRYLLGLINNILDVSKIESGKMELHCEPYTFHMFLDSLYTMIEPMCIEDKIKFVTESDENYPTIIVDATRFNQIFYNFLSNAVKYTPAGGTVKFKMENVVKTDDTLEWDSIISDTGIGMSEEFQKEMFDPFAQEETKQRGAVPKMNGTGLGLAIAKSFTELMGGHIKVDSKLGEGTKITVHMCCPLADEENMPEEKTETTPCDIGGMSLLLAEDHPLNAEIARRLLEKKGARVMWCENGRLAAEAFEKSRINEFDAVLMDIRMPIMDGYTATKAIRALARPDAKSVPIIAMTANAYESDRQASITAGMNAHISKPISPQILYDTLSSFYKNKKDS
ncbi:MAG: response regulator [Clostridia bacterium]|nr:response regulator [Clostridia bacterium]